MTSELAACFARAVTFDRTAARSTIASECPSMGFKCASTAALIDHASALGLRRSVVGREWQAWQGTGMVDLIPRQVLFGNPERIAPRLSPDGKRLAWIAPHDDVLNVW